MIIPSFLLLYACVLAVVGDVLLLGRCKKKDKALDDYARMRDENEEKRVRESCEFTKASCRKRTYGLVGDLFHHLDCIDRKVYDDYLPLIQELGQYVRGNYWLKANTFVSGIEKRQSDPDSDYAFSCLLEEQNRRLKSMLRDVVAGEKDPDVLVELLRNLVFYDDFDKAISFAEHAFTSKKND